MSTKLYQSNLEDLAQKLEDIDPKSRIQINRTFTHYRELMKQATGNRPDSIEIERIEDDIKSNRIHQAISAMQDDVAVQIRQVSRE